MPLRLQRAALELAFEDAGYAFGKVGNLLGELGDGLFPVDLMGLLVLEEGFEDFYELFGVGNFVVEDDAVALVEDGAAGGLEEDVGERAAGVAFAGDFFGEVVVGAEGLLATPATKTCRWGPRLVGAFELVLLDEVPAEGRAAALEEVGEGGADVALGGVAVLREGGEGFEVGLDGLVGGL